MNDINDKDKLMAALCYLPLPIPIAIVVLLVSDMRSRPFQKYHAVQSIAVFAAIVLSVIVTFVASFTGIGIVLICVPIALGLGNFYFAIKAYQREWVEIPVITKFIKGQGWV